MNNKVTIKILFAMSVYFQCGFMINTHAEIYKCTNTKGAVYYNDKPCPVKDKQKTMKAEKDVANGYVPETKKPNINANKPLNREELSVKPTNKMREANKLRDKEQGNNQSLASFNGNSSSKTKTTQKNTSRSSDVNKTGNGSTAGLAQNSTIRNNSDLNEQQAESFFIDTQAGNTDPATQ